MTFVSASRSKRCLTRAMSGVITGSSDALASSETVSATSPVASFRAGGPTRITPVYLPMRTVLAYGGQTTYSTPRAARAPMNATSRSQAIGGR